MANVANMPAVIATGARPNGEISFEIAQDGTLVLPRRDVSPQLSWVAETHRGPTRQAIALTGDDLAGVRRERPQNLLERWSRAEIVMEPLLLAAVRALAGGVPLDEAARHPARVEPAPGILVVPMRTPTLPPATHTNSILVGDRELALVEPATPYADEVDRFSALLDELGRAGRRVVALFLTHHHGDHIAAAADMRERLGVPLCAHAETARRIDVKVDRELADGEEAFGLRAIFTPGHAPGHLCYLEPRTRTLLAGDMVAGEGTILIAPQDDGDMTQYLDSLARMAALDAHVLVPAHGPPIASPRALCEHYIKHRLMREDKVVAALQKGPARPDELLPAVYDDTPRAAWPLAAISLLAHLEKLAREGRARAEGDRWRLC
jgi:glyoxylase-like metal-dependent hydrolase (beta-lactamase superfamily II)